MNRVVHMMKTGDFNPHFFDWPTLTFYLNLVVSCLTFLGRRDARRVEQPGSGLGVGLYLAGRQFTALAAPRRWH
jgi:hypothetical protein